MKENKKKRNNIALQINIYVCYVVCQPRECISVQLAFNSIVAKHETLKINFLFKNLAAEKKNIQYNCTELYI